MHPSQKQPVVDLAADAKKGMEKRSGIGDGDVGHQNNLTLGVAIPTQEAGRGRLDRMPIHLIQLISIG